MEDRCFCVGKWGSHAIKGPSSQPHTPLSSAATILSLSTSNTLTCQTILCIARRSSSNNRNDDGTSRSTGEDSESPFSFLVFQTSLLKSTKSRVYFLYASFHTVLGKDSE